MRAAVRRVGLLLVVPVLCGRIAAGQKSAPQQNVTVVVVDAHPTPPKPVPTVRVSLSYLDNGTHITDARDTTNPKGLAYLQVSSDAAQRGDLRIEISGATDLAIYQPADGQLTGLPTSITVKLLPKGSPALLGPAQIEAMLHRALLQVSQLQKQNRDLQAIVANASATPDQPPALKPPPVVNQKLDLSATLAQVAKANGFTAAEFDKKAQSWAQQVKGDTRADTRKKALAELAQKNYAAAAQLFSKAVDADGAALDAAAHSTADVRRAKLRQLLQDAQQGANALQLSLQYHQATVMLESAANRAAAQQKSLPQDKTMRAIWLDSSLAVADARWAEGRVAPASQSLPLLAQAAADYQTLAQAYLTAEDKPSWATAEVGLGDALREQGQRTDGSKATALLDQAIHAYRSALEVRTRADFPHEWAKTQNSLGYALAVQGTSGNGDQSAALLDQATLAIRSALEVRTKTDTPQDWAETLNLLGCVLAAEGGRASSDKANGLFDQSTQAFNSALEVRTKIDLPKAWAETQTDLADALVIESVHSSTEKAAVLTDHAVQAIRNALEVYTKADLPQDWAATEISLGKALLTQQNYSNSDQSEALIEQAVQAVRSALEVYTRADLPQGWATAEKYLGDALFLEGTHKGGNDGLALCDQALQAFHSALEVFNKADFPQAWALTEYSLAVTLTNESRGLSAARAIEQLNAAMQALRSALEVYTRVDLPQMWAMAQHQLGSVLMDDALRVSGSQSMDMLYQAEQAYKSAQEIDTKANVPQLWAMNENSIGVVYVHEGERNAGAKAMALFDQAVQCYQRVLEVDTKGSFPQQWATTQVNLAAALWNESQRSKGKAAKPLLDQTAQAYGNAMQVFTKASAPSLWAQLMGDLATVYKAQGNNAGAQQALSEAQLVMVPTRAVSAPSRRQTATAQSLILRSMEDMVTAVPEPFDYAQVVTTVVIDGITIKAGSPVALAFRKRTPTNGYIRPVAVQQDGHLIFFKDEEYPVTVCDPSGTAIPDYTKMLSNTEIFLGANHYIRFDNVNIDSEATSVAAKNGGLLTTTKPLPAGFNSGKNE